MAKVSMQGANGMREKIVAVLLALVLVVCAGVLTSCSQRSEGSQNGDAAQQESNAQAGVSKVPSVSQAGTLRVDGTQLVDQNGNAVQLKGLSTHGLAWFPGYVNSDFFAQMHDEWGCNVVRLALYTEEYGGYCAGGDQAKLETLVDKGVQYAVDNDMYVIIDWHTLSDNNPLTHVDQAKQFFASMSQKYANTPNVIFEICNEPNGATTWAQVKQYAEDIIPIIRQNAPDAIIIVGTPLWDQRVDEAAADPIHGYSNIMYTLHYYAATHKQDLRSVMESAHEQGLPIFVTEYGICDASGNGAIDKEEADAWVADMNSLGISYVMWNVSNKNEASSIIKDSCDKTSGFTTEDLSEAGTWFVSMMSASEK